MLNRHSLFTKILLWFFLNMAFVVIIMFAIFQFRFRIDLNSPLWGRSTSNLLMVSKLVRFELSQSPSSEWNGILERYSSAYDVTFVLHKIDGQYLAGKQVDLPPKVINEMKELRFPIFDTFNRTEFAKLEKVHFNERHKRFKGPERQLFRIKTNNPTRYYIGFPSPVFDEEISRPILAVFVLISDSIFKSGLYPEPMPWMITIAVIILISIAWWFPMVRNLTKPIAEITASAQNISQGDFDVKVDENRSDEIGHLGQAINRMSRKLAGYVYGQKRFLSDIAHELGSPVARMQMGMGIMEKKIQDPDLKKTYEDISEEVEIMAGLVNELLSYSRADINPEKIKLQPVNLMEISKKVVLREGDADSVLEIDMDPELTALADPELISRALSNLLRNAIRYAKQYGPITVKGELAGDNVLLSVIDSGSGVKEQDLERLFEPFFRPKTDRSRDTGGAGLGLAIVKTCVNGCQGEVSARNLSPKGFAVEIQLQGVKKTS